MEEKKKHVTIARDIFMKKAMIQGVIMFSPSKDS